MRFAPGNRAPRNTETGAREMTNFAQNVIGVVAAFVFSGLAFAVTLAGA
jgi:hypothetical protein